MFDWIKDHDTLLWWLTAASVVMFLGSLIIMPMLVARIPADYFVQEERPPSKWMGHHPALRITLMIGKNLLGVVLILAGLAMLLIPGQGLLTMLIGVLLLDLPGKYRFEKWLITRPRIHRAINWLRAKAGREPLITDGQ
jgi:archaellum biogenesis protein FlaJ (TadC family)